MTKFNLDRYAALGRFAAQCDLSKSVNSAVFEAKSPWAYEEFALMQSQETVEARREAHKAFDRAYSATILKA
jgi:hypothetical protein